MPPTSLKCPLSKADKILMKAIFTLLAVISAFNNIQAFPDIGDLQNKVEGILAPKTNKQCKLEDPKELTSVETLSLNSCFGPHHKAKIEGTKIHFGSFRCEIPIDFVIACSKKDWEKAPYRNLKIKALEIDFSNTKSTAHIPPRGWTTKIVLDKFEEEAQDGPTPELISISCFSGEKMMSLQDFQRIFEDTIKFN